MGCLKNIIKIIILVLAVIGFNAIGGLQFFQDKLNINFFEKPTQEELVDKSSKIADLSGINDEYEIEKTANFIGFKSIVIKHKATKQKMIIADTGKKEFLTKADFQNKNVDTKIKDIAEKIQYQFIRLEDIKITERGQMNTLGQTAPYVRFTADAVNLPVGEIQGILGAANGKNKHNIMIISFNDSSKYSQIITQQFFKDVK